MPKISISQESQAVLHLGNIVLLTDINSLLELGIVCTWEFH